MKNLTTSFFVLLFAVAFSLPAAAKQSDKGYKISVQINGSQDSMLLLCYYRAQNTYVVDTAFNNGKGLFLFKKKEELKPGLYFFTNDDGKYVEFVVYHETPNFKFTTDDRSWGMNISVKGSPQNEVLFNYNRISESLFREMQEQRSVLDSASFAAFSKAQRQKLDSVKLEYIASHPDAMIARMMVATREVPVPTLDSAGNQLSKSERYDYYMHHYFDNIPLDDDFIIRTPKEVFYQKVVDYVEKYMHGMPPEMICPLLDSLIDRSEPAPEVYRWLVNYLTEHFLQSNVMVYDEVYVHLVQRYFATGKADWYSPSTIDENVERANRWERLLVGREAPELILFDTLHHAYSLHRMKGRYTLLVFWSPTCGHCRDIVPAVYKVFEAYADQLDMRAFTILTETDEQTVQKWKSFMKERKMNSPRWICLNGGEANVDWHEVYDVTSTPQIYLIDNSTHKILAKKVNANILEQIVKTLK